MTRISDRELKDRLRAAGRPEPPANLLEQLKSEIPDNLAVGGDGLRLAGRSERPRVVGIRQVTLLAASLLVVVGTGFLAFTVLAPERSYLDRTAFDQVPEAYVVTVPPRIFVAAKREQQAVAMQDASDLAKQTSTTPRRPALAEEGSPGVIGPLGDGKTADSLVVRPVNKVAETAGAILADTTADSRRAIRTEKTTASIGALGGENEADTVGAVRKDKAEVAAAAPAAAPAIALPASPGLGAGSPAGVKDLPMESRKTAGSVVATRQEADAARSQHPNETARTLSDSARRQTADETGTAGAGAEFAERARADAPARPAMANANQADRAVILRDEKLATTGPGVSLTVVPAGDGHEPAILLRDGQGHPVAAARVTVTARSDGRVVGTHSDRHGLVRAALTEGEYRVEIRITAASEPVVATLHVDAAGWHVFPPSPASP